MTIAVVTVRPNNLPNHLYVGGDNETIYEMKFLGQTFDIETYDASTALALEDILKAHGYYMDGPWERDVEYWQAPVVSIR